MKTGLVFLSSFLSLAQITAVADEEEYNFFAAEGPMTAGAAIAPADSSSDDEGENYSFFVEENGYPGGSGVQAATRDGAADEEADDFNFFAGEEPALSSAPGTLNFQTALPIKKDKKVPLSFRFNGELGFWGAFDVRHDQAGENVTELQSRGLFTAEARLGHYMRIYSNFALYWDYMGQKPEGDKPYVLFNTAENRYFGGLDLLETFAEFNFTAGLSLRVGNLLFPWGQNDVLPAISLNPLDGRLLYQNGVQLHAPLPAVGLTYNKKWFTGRLAFIPWFKPHKVALTGRDFSLAPAGSSFKQKLAILDKVSPTLLQELEDDPLATDLPDYSIKNSTIALRLEAESRRADFALSAVYGWDRTPHLQLDDNLLLLIGRAGDLLASPLSILTDAELSSAFLALKDNYQAGESLFKLEYLRQATFAFDMAVQIWDFILKLDVSFSPHKILYDADLHYSRSPYLQGAMALEYNYGTSLFLSLTVFAMFSFDNRLLPLLDFRMMSDSSSYLVGFFFMGRKTFLDDRLKIELVSAISATFGDFLLRGTIDYKLAERHVFGLGTMFIHGPAGSLGARYDNADNIFTYYRWLF